MILIPDVYLMCCPCHASGAVIGEEDDEEDEDEDEGEEQYGAEVEALEQVCVYLACTGLEVSTLFRKPELGLVPAACIGDAAPGSSLMQMSG
jgi:hypothetical protein